MEVNGAMERRILRIDGDLCREADDLLIVERAVGLVLDGEACAQTVMTPGHEDLWALGHLRCLGLIEGKGDVERLEVKEDGAVVEVWRHNPHPPTGLCKNPVFRRGAHCASAAPGLKTTQNGRPMAAPTKNSMPGLRDVVRDGIRWLAEAPLYTSTGAAHVAALVASDGTKLVRMEDVGRHNAVDKAVGWALANEVDLAGTMLLTSGRLPEDMVAKAVAAGVPVMASVSAATAQGVAMAERHGLTLIGFVRGERMNVYAGYPSVSRASSSCVLKPAKDFL